MASTFSDVSKPSTKVLKSGQSLIIDMGSSKGSWDNANAGGWAQWSQQSLANMLPEEVQVRFAYKILNFSNHALIGCTSARLTEWMGIYGCGPQVHPLMVWTLSHELTLEQAPPGPWGLDGGV